MTPPTFHLCSSLLPLALLSLALLGLLPSAYTLPQPRHPAPLHSSLEHPDWEAALLQLQASLGLPLPWGPLQELGLNSQGHDLAVELEPEEGWDAEGGRKGQREGWARGPMVHFPDHPLETLHYLEGVEEEGEGGEKRNEALTSIAGGLQAFNRQKGGFGFRFGKK